MNTQPTHTQNTQYPMIDKTWIAASYTRNFLLNDPLLDWLNMYGTSKGFVKDSDTQTELHKKLNFTKFIITKGEEFEKHIVSIIKNKFKDDFVEISNKMEFPLFLKYRRQMKDTIESMKKGVKIIYQGIVYDHKNKTFGYPDLLIRSDFINTMFENKIISDKKSRKGCNFSNEWHYRVVDIKFTCLKLTSDNFLTNNGSVLCYKGQNYIYNRGLGHIQGLYPRKAYILGRGVDKENDYNLNPFETLGQIDYVNNDIKVTEQVDKAIEWIRLLRYEGMNWSIFPYPSVPELYPNMCNDMDSDWSSAKKHICSNLKDITMLWNCGIKARNICRDHQIFSWNDERCTISTLGFKTKTKTSEMVNDILTINRSNDKVYNFDKDMYSNYTKYLKDDDNIKSFFVDFETVYNINDIESKEDMNIIFMIGSCSNVQSEPNNSTEYSCFSVNKLCVEEEKEILLNFVKYLKKHNYGNNKVRVYHYNSTEKVTFEKRIKKYNIHVDIDIEWIDILDIVKNIRFVIKNCFDFSLKSIVDVLYSHKLIDMNYKQCEIANGSQAMIAAFLSNRESVDKNISMNDTELMKYIRKYNYVDCMTLKKIKEFLMTIN